MTKSETSPTSGEPVAGRQGEGDSGGGAYPNPHTGKNGGEKDGFLGRGGQTGMAYHGEGSLGDEEVGDNANALAGGGAGDRKD